MNLKANSELLSKAMNHLYLPTMFTMDTGICLVYEMQNLMYIIKTLRMKLQFVT